MAGETNVLGSTAADTAKTVETLTSATRSGLETAVATGDWPRTERLAKTLQELGQAGVMFAEACEMIDRCWLRLYQSGEPHSNTNI